MKRVLTFLFCLLSLSGCGVLLPYMYSSQGFDDHLALSMPKEQVLKSLGKPDRIVLEDGQQSIWEYRLYPKGEWVGYLVHCPLFPNCYFPAEVPSPYYVVLQENHLCLWGTPSTVRPLIRMACGDALRSKQSNAVKARRQASVIPVFMPPPVMPLPQRLAIVPIGGSVNSAVNSWFDLTLTFLRSRHPELILVEREDLRTVLSEVGLQYGGRVDDDTTIHVGRLVGADSLLTHRTILPEDRTSMSAGFELRLLRVESGTTVFRQMTSASQTTPEPLAATMLVNNSESVGRLIALEEASAYGLAALTAAFGDNPLGIVSDYAWSGKGIKLIDVLQGGPAMQAGLKPGDQILTCNDRPLASWADTLSLPARLIVHRNQVDLEINVQPISAETH